MADFCNILDAAAAVCAVAAADGAAVDDQPASKANCLYCWPADGWDVAGRA